MKNIRYAGYMEGYMCKQANIFKMLYDPDKYIKEKGRKFGNEFIEQKMQSPEAYMAAAGVGGMAGAGMGMGLGAAYADDNSGNKMPYVGYGGLMGAGAGGLSGMALLALLNTYRAHRKKKQEKKK